MAREVTKVELFGANRDGEPVSYTIASATLVNKGAYLKFDDPRTASAQTESSEALAGFANQEKVADYSTTISVWTDGIFGGTASGTIAAGDWLMVAKPGNYVKAISSGVSGDIASQAIHYAINRKIGYALEDATAGTAVTFRLQL